MTDEETIVEGETSQTSEKKTSRKSRAKKEATQLPKPAFKAVINRPRMTFAQYAKIKGIRPQHRGGMQAFVKHIKTPRTRAQWDKLFETY